MTKICSKCGTMKDRDEFHKRSDTADGLRADCKECRAIVNREYGEANKAKINRYNKKYYVENKDKIEKQKKIYNEANKDKVAEYQKEYRKNNKEKLRKWQTKYYSENREHLLRDKKEYYQENKEEILKLNEKYYKENQHNIIVQRKKRYKENKEEILENQRQYYANNKKKVMDYQKLYNARNPHKSKEHNHKRVARKSNLPHTLTVVEWECILKDFNNSCAYCGMTKEEHFEKFNENLHQEHFIALSKGGEYTHNNIIPSCKRCNTSKNNSSFNKWYPKQDFYSKKREQFILKYLNYKGKNIQQLSIL